MHLHEKWVQLLHMLSISQSDAQQATPLALAVCITLLVALVAYPVVTAYMHACLYASNV